jgi:Kef-type K+ transport system membrane component KefB
MNEELSGLQSLLLSPLAVIGAGLMLSQIVGLLLYKRGIPKLYGAVLAGLVLGTSGFGLVDAPLIALFQDLFNAAAALVLFEVGRKMDLDWLWNSGRQGASLVIASVLRGAATMLCLAAFGLEWGEAAFIGAILIAVNPIIFSSMVSDSNASGVATYSSANMVGLSNLIALLAVGIALSWLKSNDVDAEASFIHELSRQIMKLALGALIAVVCYGLYAIATRISRAHASTRPGMLLAALLMDLGLCSISAASALLSLLLMGLMLRNASKRDNVFQAQLKTGQDIGYALLFMVSAALVDLQQLMHMATLLMAALVFAVRIGVTRLALQPNIAWNTGKKNAMALSLCSLVSFGSLVVDNSVLGYSGLSATADQTVQALLALNVLIAPGLTWWGLRMAGETHEEPDYG